jgi:hypothetical protein
LEKEILTVWKRKLWQFGNGNFDSFCDTVFYCATHSLDTTAINYSLQFNISMWNLITI